MVLDPLVVEQHKHPEREDQGKGDDVSAASIWNDGIAAPDTSKLSPAVDPQRDAADQVADEDEHEDRRDHGNYLRSMLSSRFSLDMRRVNS